MKALKKILASVSALSIALLAVSSSALAFNDVEGHWVQTGGYLDTLVNEGVIDGTKDTFRPDANLNRAELIKMVVNYDNGGVDPTSDDYTIPTTPTFSDVAKDAWYYNHVEAAAGDLGIVDSTKGTFRPTANITRAEALKIMTLGLQVASNSDRVAPYADVKAGDWYYDYVTTAYNNGIIKAADNFRPGDNITRAEAAKIFAAALNPVVITPTPTVTVTPTTSGTPAPTATPMSNGTLEVSLSKTTPAANSVPCNAQSLVFAKYDLATSGEDVAVNGITLNRSELGSKDDFSRVWIEDETGARITARQTVGSDETAPITFNTPLVVKAGQVRTISVVAKLKAFNDVNSDGIKQSTEACYSGRYNALGISASTNVLTNGKVSGAFPLVGARMQTVDYATATLSSSIAGSTSTYQVGDTDKELGQWRLTNNHSTRDILFKTLTVKNEGTGKIATDLANLKLVVNGKTISKSVTTTGEYATFVFDAYTLPAGRTDSFYIRGDIVGQDSASAETIKLTVRYSEDFSAIETSTGFGISHDLDTVFTAAAATAYTIQGGDTTFVKSSTAPASQTKPKGAIAAVFLDSSLTVKQDFTTDAIIVTLYANTPNNLITAAYTDTATPPVFHPAVYGTTTASVAADLKNLKLLVDGASVQTKSGDTADFTSCAADTALGANGLKCTLNFDSTVRLNKGIRSVKLVGDIENNAVSGGKYRAEIAGSTAFTSAKYISNDRSIATVAGTVTGGDITIGASNLTISENSGYSAGQKFVSGAQNITIGKFTVKANDSDDVRVTRLKFALIPAAAPATSVSGADIPSAMVFVDGVQKGTTQSFTTGTTGTVDFSSVDFTVLSNKQAVVELKANLTNSASGNLQVALSGIDAKDTSSSYASINSSATFPTYTAATTGVNLAIQTAGTLSIANNSSTPTSAVISPKTAETNLGIFTLSAQDDDVKITNLYFQTVAADGTTPVNIASRIKTISLYDDKGVKITDGVVNGTTGYVYFDIGNSSTLVVPRNSNSYKIFVSATFNDITTVAQTASVIKLALNGVPTDAVSGTATTGVRAVSVGNNNVLATVAETGAVASETMFLAKSSLSFASVDDSSLVSTTTKFSGNSAMKAYAFTVKADAAGDAELGSVVLNISKSGAAAVSNIRVYEKGKESTLLVDAAAAPDADKNQQLSFSTAQRISAGTTKTYIVELNVTGGAIGDGLSVRLVSGTGDAAFGKIAAPLAGLTTQWSDFADTAHSSTPAPLLDWFKGYKLDGLNSMSSRSYSAN